MMKRAASSGSNQKDQRHKKKRRSVMSATEKKQLKESCFSHWNAMLNETKNAPDDLDNRKTNFEEPKKQKKKPESRLVIDQVALQQFCDEIAQKYHTSRGEALDAIELITKLFLYEDEVNIDKRFLNNSICYLLTLSNKNQPAEVVRLLSAFVRKRKLELVRYDDDEFHFDDEEVEDALILAPPQCGENAAGAMETLVDRFIVEFKRKKRLFSLKEMALVDAPEDNDVLILFVKLASVYLVLGWVGDLIPSQSIMDINYIKNNHASQELVRSFLLGCKTRFGDLFTPTLQQLLEEPFGPSLVVVRRAIATHHHKFMWLHLGVIHSNDNVKHGPSIDKKLAPFFLAFGLYKKTPAQISVEPVTSTVAGTSNQGSSEVNSSSPDTSVGPSSTVGAGVVSGSTTTHEHTRRQE